MINTEFALICFVVFLLILFGLALLNGLGFTDLSEKAFNSVISDLDLLKEIERAKGKKRSFIIRELTAVRNSMMSLGKGSQFRIACVSSVFLCLFGALLSMLIGNVFMIPVLSFVLASVPFIISGISVAAYKKRIAEELETALSVITNSYLRTENFVDAVKENIGFIKRPLRDVFASFVNDTAVITPDLDLSVLKLREKIDNPLFHEWCDSVRASLNDRTLKDTLSDVVSKFTDSKIINNELLTIVQEPRKEYFAMVLITLGNFPLLRLLNKEWFDVLANTVQGKFVMALVFGGVVVSGFLMMKYTKPIEYK
ncbi:MAG: hypothetical protein K6G89_03045 [Clostridia bacterium]|nr:hypothetical protein [Clostridia bacterium]